MGLAAFAFTMFGSMFFVMGSQFDSEKIACIRAGGDGKILHSELGMPIGYKCMRMHLVMKYKNGEYR
jgi:hypothetical protein